MIAAKQAPRQTIRVSLRRRKIFAFGSKRWQAARRLRIHFRSGRFGGLPSAAGLAGNDFGSAALPGGLCFGGFWLSSFWLSGFCSAALGSAALGASGLSQSAWLVATVARRGSFSVGVAGSTGVFRFEPALMRFFRLLGPIFSSALRPAGELRWLCWTRACIHRRSRQICRPAPHRVAYRHRGLTTGCGCTSKCDGSVLSVSLQLDPLLVTLISTGSDRSRYLGLRSTKRCEPIPSSIVIVSLRIASCRPVNHRYRPRPACQSARR